MTQTFSESRQEAERQHALGMWESLVREVKRLAKAAGTPLYTEKHGMGLRCVYEAEAISVNKGRSYEGGGPWASLVTWGHSYERTYHVEVESVERWRRGRPAFRRSLKNTTAPMLYDALVHFGEARRARNAREAEGARKMEATYKREAKQVKLDKALLGIARGGPGHHAKVETGTSGYHVTTTFTVLVDDQVPPEVREAFEALVRQWRRVAEAYPYPRGGGA